MEKQVQFFKNRAHNIQTELDSRVRKGRDAALQLKRLTQQLEETQSFQEEQHQRNVRNDALIDDLQKKLDGTQFFLEEQHQQNVRKDALIAALRKNTKDALVFYADNLGASPSAQTNKNVKRWASTALRTLQTVFPDPKHLHCVLRSLASTELSAADIYHILEKRQVDLDGSTFLQNQIKAGQEEFRDFLQDHLCPAIGENLIKTLMISRRKYERLNHRLFYTIGENEQGKRVPLRLSFNGVEVPHLPLRRALEKYRSEILGYFEHAVEDDGLSTSVNLRKVLKEDVLASIRQGFFLITCGEVRQLDGRLVQVMQYTDTANQFKVRNRIKKNKHTHTLTGTHTHTLNTHTHKQLIYNCTYTQPRTHIHTHVHTQSHNHTRTRHTHRG
jgi:hypothetical protein